MRHRLKLEHVSSLSQRAAVQDVATEIMCDNLQTLAALTAQVQAGPRAVDRVNHAHAHTALKPAMPALLLGKKIAGHLREVLRLLGNRTCLHREKMVRVKTGIIRETSIWPSGP